MLLDMIKGKGNLNFLATEIQSQNSYLKIRGRLYNSGKSQHCKSWDNWMMELRIWGSSISILFFRYVFGSYRFGFGIENNSFEIRV